MELKRYVDLHTHTTCSDGTFTPEELVKLAAQRGIEVLAITDHDNVSGVKRAMLEANNWGVKVIPGIECSTTFEIGKRHILGYGIDTESEILKKYISRCKQDRLDKVCKILDKLKALGMNITFEEVLKFPGSGSVGRPHIALAMLEKGYVKSIKEAFDLYIDKGKPAYATVRSISVEEVIDTIKQAGGIAVLAHPSQMRFNNINYTLAEAERLVAMGLEGIEVVYPEHDKDECYSYAAYALRRNLYVTCGSDFHGEIKPNKLASCFYNGDKVSVDAIKKFGRTFF